MLSGSCSGSVGVPRVRVEGGGLLRLRPWTKDLGAE